MIPISASSSTQFPTRRSSAATPAAGGETQRIALVVDDDPAIRSLGALVLESLGFKALIATNGLEALVALEKTPGIQVVLLDLLMPVMTGEEAFHVMRKAWPEVAVVVISGLDAAEIERRFGASGPDGFVQKPFSIAKLSGVLAHALS